MSGVVGLLIAVACAGVVLVAGRWLAGLPFGERGLLAAITPWAVASGRLRAARAAGGIVGFYLGIAAIVTIGALAGGTPVYDETSMRVTVAASGPAARAGIRDGDRIVAVEGTSITDWDQLRKVVGPRAGEPTRITVERAGSHLEVEAVPQTIDGIGKILVGPFREVRSTSMSEAIGRGLSMPFAVATSTGKELLRLLAGAERVELSGPAGIGREVGKVTGIPMGILFGAALSSYFWPMIAFVNIGFAFIRRRATRSPPLA